jgi:hypothetical protein
MADNTSDGGGGAPPAGKAATAPKSHFIPFDKADIIKMCIEEGGLPASDHEGFREFAKILSALFHHEYHDRLETLKETYSPLNPDEATRRFKEPTPDERVEAEKRFIDMLREVLTGANFTELSREDIQRSISADPRLGMRMVVDLDEFQRVCVFRRETHTEKVTEKKLAGRVKREFERSYYDRVVLYLRFKDTPPEPDVNNGGLGQGQPGQAYLKLFSRVPVDGLEMLFPNAKMRMTTLDKVLIGGPAAFGGIMMVMNKLLPTILAVLAIIAFWLGFREKEPDAQKFMSQLVGLGLGGFAVYMFIRKQLKKIRRKRAKYLQMLMQNLYFRVFDNNAGVLHHLIGNAEDEDFKEAILAHYFLLTRDRPMTEKELDKEIEERFASWQGTSFDFEVDDAARKLERMGLAKRDEGGRLTVTSLAESKQRLDWLWDNFFTFNEEQ